MTRETILDRVQKLWALANHPATSLEEAANAAAQATKLTMKYNLEDWELEKAGKKAKDGYIHRVLEDISYKQYQRLAWLIARANLCDAVSLGKKLSVVGKPENIDVVVYLYNYTKREINRLLCNDWNANKWSYLGRKTTKANHWTAFWYGALDAIEDKFRQQKRDRAAEPQTMALVVLVEEELKTAMATVYGPIRPLKQRRAEVDSTSYTRGWAAGHSTNANPALGGK